MYCKNEKVQTSNINGFRIIPRPLSKIDFEAVPLESSFEQELSWNFPRQPKPLIYNMPEAPDNAKVIPSDSEQRVVKVSKGISGDRSLEQFVLYVRDQEGPFYAHRWTHLYNLGRCFI